MRYVLAIAFACMIGTPTAFAMPTLRPNSLSRGDATVQTVGHKYPRNYRRSRGTGGIHPLVGSGNY
jgi:hypothetical protein